MARSTIEGDWRQAAGSMMMSAMLVWVLAVLVYGVWDFWATIYDPDLLWLSEVVTHKKHSMDWITPTGFIIRSAVVSFGESVCVTILPFTFVMLLLAIFRYWDSGRPYRLRASFLRVLFAISILLSIPYFGCYFLCYTEWNDSRPGQPARKTRVYPSAFLATIYEPLAGLESQILGVPVEVTIYQ